MSKLEEEETYFLIRLASNKYNLLSIQEEKELSENEYHPMDSEEFGEYNILVETQEKEGTKLSLSRFSVSEEVYQTYKFESVYFKKINDFDLDGFLYDKKRGIVFYGYIYGLYAVERDGTYYSAITDEKIPREVIDSISKRETVDDFNDMVEDLEFIGNHKDIYLRVIDEEIRLLQEGANNRKNAHERYKNNYNQAKKLAAETEASKEQKKQREEAWETYMQSQKEEDIAIASKRKEASQLIYQIRNTN